MDISLLLKALPVLAITTFVAAKFPTAKSSVKPSIEAKQSPGSNVEGRVIQSLVGDNYTYVKVETGADKLWIATPKALGLIPAGETVNCKILSSYEAYESKSLVLAFEKMNFSKEFKIVKASSLASV